MLPDQQKIILIPNEITSSVKFHKETRIKTIITTFE